MRDDGGSAFPRTGFYPHLRDHESHDALIEKMETLTQAESGMTLRDWFAGQALAGLIANEAIVKATSNPAERAEAAYKAADAMLQERNK